MFQLTRFYTIFTIAILSIIFYEISVYAGILQENITGKFNSFQSFIFQINNLTSAIFPLLIYTFIYITTQIFFIFFNIDKEKASLSKIISVALLPVIVFSLVYLVVLIHFVKNIDGPMPQEFKNLKLISSFTFNDFKNIGYLFWGLFYLILIVEIKSKFELSILKSLIINLTPTSIVSILIQII